MLRQEVEDAKDGRKRCAILGSVTALLAGVIFGGITLKIWGFQPTTFGYFVLALLVSSSLGLLIGLLVCCYKLNRSEAAARRQRVDTASLHQDYLDDHTESNATNSVTYKPQNDVHVTSQPRAPIRNCASTQSSGAYPYTQFRNTAAFSAHKSRSLDLPGEGRESPRGRFLPAAYCSDSPVRLPYKNYQQDRVEQTWLPQTHSPALHRNRAEFTV